MRKADYNKIVEICSVQKADAPYSLHTIVPPMNIGKVVINYQSIGSGINPEVAKKVEAQWKENLEKAMAEFATKGKKTEVRPHEGGSPSLALYDVETGRPIRFSRPMMRYDSHGVNLFDSDRAQITLYLGQTNFAEHVMAHKVSQGTVAWSFGPSSFVILTDDDQRRYVLFGDRAKGIQHTNQDVEREFYPKGYFYIDELNALSKIPVGDELESGSVLDALVRKQLSEQSNFPEDVIANAEVEPITAFLISAPHFDANVSHAIHIKLPCKAEDFGQFHKGSKYTSSSFIRLEDLADFVEKQGNNLMPISRHLLWAYALRHPELVEL